MIRVNIIVEGQTEEAFATHILSPYFAERDIVINPRRVETGRKRGIIYRGGVANNKKIYNDIMNWIKEDQGAWVTTMFDLYAIPANFPGIEGLDPHSNPYDKVQKVEDAFEDDIAYHKFIPYIAKKS